MSDKHVPLTTISIDPTSTGSAENEAKLMEDQPKRPGADEVPDGMEVFKDRNYMIIRNESLRKWGKCLNSFICCGDSWGFRYTFTYDSKTVMQGAERDSFCKTLCCGLKRSWWIDIFAATDDNAAKEAKPIFSFDRKFRPTSPWFFGCIPLGMLWCCCEHQSVNVFDRSQKKIGSIRQIFRFFHPQYEVHDDNDYVVYRVGGPVCKLECFGEVKFPIMDAKGEEIAEIKTGDKPGCLCCGHVYDKDNYQVHFPSGMPVKHKALLTAAAILFDYNYLANANPIRWG